MSRGTIIAIIVLTVALAALLVLPKLNRTPTPAAPAVSTTAVASATTQATAPAPAPAPKPVAPTVTSSRPAVSTQAMAAAIGNQAVNPKIIRSDEPDPQEPVKPLPTLERDYLATTNHETRLDLMMDISENPSAEAVKTLTRLFQAEMDPELKVDLLDSLLGIEGFKDEKLIMLTLGLQQGLPNDVRQSAIDGLIDLEDTRSISLLNGLLNDPDPEIRESAQDAIELLQTPPQQVPKLR